MDLITFIIVALVLAAASAVLSELLRPKPKFEDARPASLGDFRFPTATEGRPVPILWGTVKVEGPNVVWYGDLKQKPITKNVPTGLFSSKTIITGFKYYIGFQFGLCRGPGCSLLRVWIGNKLLVSIGGTSFIVDDPKFNGGPDFGNGGIKGTFSFYPGSETQVANAYLATQQIPTVTYRGTCYGVWEGGYIGNSTQVEPWKFEIQRLPNGLGATNPAVNGGLDSNLACAMYELLTDGDWGFGFLPSEIDTDNFKEVADILYAEGNGLSIVLDSVREATDILQEFERQIDGVLVLDQHTGKYRIKLARGDFDVNDIPQLNASNVMEVMEFTRGTWEDTSNQVRINFSDRSRDYFDTFAQAVDLANQRIQGGKIFPSTQTFPGVKDPDLANNLASRGIRRLSSPLAKAQVSVDRSMWNLQVGDVVAWTDTILGFEQLTMRVTKIDFGLLTDNHIELSLVQDVFQFSEPFSGRPQVPLWQRPTQPVEPIPTDESLIFESPKAFVDRDPGGNFNPDRVWAGARAQTGKEIKFDIYQRHSSGTPTGSFVKSGSVFGFFLIGELNADVDAPDATFRVDPSPDAEADIFAAFTQAATALNVGQNLVNLCLVGDEFLAPTSVEDHTTYTQFTTVYRGLLDTVAATHSAGDKVYLVFVAGGMTDDSFPRNNNVDVKLVPESATDILDVGDANTVSITLNDRYRRPYPAALPNINGTDWATTANADAALP
jgi:hypothetical protein